MADIKYAVDVSDIVRARQEIRRWQKENSEAISVVNSRMQVLGKSSSVAFTQFGNAVTNSGKAANRFGVVTQQAGYQVGDFLVQIQSGTNPLVAFGQQATQLVGVLPLVAGGFGLTAKAAIGISAALSIAIPLATAIGAAFMRTQSSAQETKSAMDQLADSLRLVEEVTDRLNLSVDDMITKYGTATGTIREFAIAQAESALAQAEQRLNDQIMLLDGVTQRYTEATRVVSEFGESLDYSDVLRTITRDFGVSAQEAFRLYDAFVAIDEATTFEQQRQALLEIDRVLASAGVKASDLPPELNRALFELRDMVFAADQLAKAMDKVKTAARNMTFGNPLALAGLTGEQLLPPKPDEEDKPSGAGSRGQTIGQYLSALEEEAKLKRSLVGLTSSEVYEKQRLFDITKQALEKEGALGEKEKARIENLVKLELQTRQLTEAEQKRQQMQETYTTIVENGLMTLVDGASSVEDAFKGMLRNILLEIYRQQVAKPFAEIGGNIISKLFGFSAGGAFANGRVTAFADGGVVSSPTFFPMRGGTGLMGEAGPEAIMPLKRGKDGKLGVAMSGTGETIVINQTINVSTGVQQTVRAEIKSLMPQIAEQSKMAVLDAKRRGGSYGSKF